MKLEICIDADDVDRAVEFYGRGLGLAVLEHHPDCARVKLNEHTFWIMKVAPGRLIPRDYRTVVLENGGLVDLARREPEPAFR